MITTKAIDRRPCWIFFAAAMVATMTGASTALAATSGKPPAANAHGSPSFKVGTQASSHCPSGLAMQVKITSEHRWKESKKHESKFVGMINRNDGIQMLAPEEVAMTGKDLLICQDAGPTQWVMVVGRDAKTGNLIHFDSDAAPTPAERPADLLTQVQAKAAASRPSIIRTDVAIFIERLDLPDQAADALRQLAAVFQAYTTIDPTKDSSGVAVATDQTADALSCLLAVSPAEAWRLARELQDATFNTPDMIAHLRKMGGASKIKKIASANRETCNSSS